MAFPAVLAQGLLPGGTEWIVIIVLIVVLFYGATKIPELARAMGRAKGEFRRGEDEVDREREEEKLRRRAEELGIDPAGKSIAQLRQEIAKRSG